MSGRTRDEIRDLALAYLLRGAASSAKRLKVVGEAGGWKPDVQRKNEEDYYFVRGLIAVLEGEHGGYSGTNSDIVQAGREVEAREREG